MRLRVISVGQQTRVIDEDTGELVEGVQSVGFSHSMDEPSLLIIRTNSFTNDITIEGVPNDQGETTE